MKIYRLKDGKMVCTVSEKFPHHVAFTNQAVLTDRDFFKEYFVNPVELLRDMSKGDIQATQVVLVQPDDEEFFDSAVGSLVVHGYQAMFKEFPDSIPEEEQPDLFEEGE